MQRNFIRFANNESAKKIPGTNNRNPDKEQIEIINKNTTSKLKKFGTTTVFNYQTIGGDNPRYAEQQDTQIAFNAAGFETLTWSERKALLKNVVAKLQEQHRSIRGGSTLNTTIAWREGNIIKTCTTNSGDSLSYILFLDENNNLKSCQLLHRLHDFNSLDPKEKAKIIDNGGYFDRAGYMYSNEHLKNADLTKEVRVPNIAMTHALGDNDFPLIRIPDIITKAFQVKNNERVIILNCSDGLFERDAITEADIKKTLKTCSLSLGLAILQLATKARLKSTDNLSLTMFEVNSNTPVGVGTFDGHRWDGKQFSIDLGEDFYKEFNNQLTETLRLKVIWNNEKATTSLSNSTEAVRGYYEYNNSLFDHWVSRPFSTAAAKAVVKIIDNLHVLNYQESREKLEQIKKSLMKESNSKQFITLLDNLIDSVKDLINQFEILKNSKEISDEKTVEKDEEKSDNQIILGI